VAAAAAFTTYGVSISSPIGAELPEARSATTITMVLVGLWILVELIRPLTRERALLVASLGGVFAVILALPFARSFFALVIPAPDVWAVIIATTIAAAILVHWSLIAIDRLWHRTQARRERRPAPAHEDGRT
jgi:cation-transporting ATPase E